MNGRERETANTTTKISSYSPTSFAKKRFALLIQVTLKYLPALHVGLIPTFAAVNLHWGITIIIVIIIIILCVLFTLLLLILITYIEN